MPDEIDVPIDDVRDKVAEMHHEQEAAHPAHDDKEGAKDWTRMVALSTAILAAVAAVGALQSGLLVNESLLQKNEEVGHLTKASDQWNYYQAEGLKSLIYRTTAQGLPPGSPTAKKDLAQADHYQQKQDELKTEANRLVEELKAASRSSETYLAKHHIFAFSVSLCQIAIALSAVAALTKRRRFWLIGLAAGAIGTALLVYGFL